MLMMLKKLEKKSRATLLQNTERSIPKKSMFKESIKGELHFFAFISRICVRCLIAVIILTRQKIFLNFQISRLLLMAQIFTQKPLSLKANRG